MSKPITLRLTLDVTYNSNGEPLDRLKAYLWDIARNAAGDGEMTGESAAEVETWRANVECID
jgi:hypothetical protein